MGRTKIEWCDITWNPVTGCRHNCPYCYARGMAKRLETKGGIKAGDDFRGNFTLAHRLCEIYEPFYRGGRYQPYPCGFTPTFHRYRLDDPLTLGYPSTVFVCSMADLFGDWVPDEWISNVIHACWRSNDMDADAVDRNGNKLVRGKPDGELHTFLFLTKNPKRIAEFEKKHFWLGSAVRPKMWFGTTVTGASDQDRVNELGNFNSDNVFLSIEPLLEALDISKLADSLQRRKYCFQKCSQINGVIVGAESGKRKGKVTPRREWIDDIVRGCDICGVPVFMKDSLLSIVGAENMRRELPWEVHKCP